MLYKISTITNISIIVLECFSNAQLTPDNNLYKVCQIFDITPVSNLELYFNTRTSYANHHKIIIKY